MISIKGTLSALLFVLVVLFSTVCGAFIGIQTVMDRNNVCEVLSSYAKTAAPRENETALQYFVSQSVYGKETVSGMPEGLFGLSRLSTIITFFRSKYGLISLMLNTVDTDKLFTRGMLQSALSDRSLAEYAAAVKGDPDAFMNTPFVIGMTVRSAYVYFEHPGAGSREETKKLVAEAVADAAGKHKEDFAVLFGRDLDAGDGPAIDALCGVFASRIAGNMVVPTEKSASMKGATKALISVCTSSGFIFSTGFLALLTMLLLLVLLRSPRSTANYVGWSLLVSGAIVIALISCKDVIAGRLIAESTGVRGNVGASFAVTGAVFCVVGLALLVTPAAYEAAKKRKNKLVLDINAETMTVSDIRVINEIGLGDIIINKENPNKRADGLVDYYGDGRGLDAQRAYRARTGTAAPRDPSPDGGRGGKAEATAKEIPAANETDTATPGKPDEED